MTTLKALLVALAAFVGVALGASPAHAVTCTLTGSLKLESQDSWFCSTGILGSTACSSWKETNLDSKQVPLQYMWMRVGLETGATDANGTYTLTFPRSGTQCAGQTVDLTAIFARVHEDDAAPHAPAPRFRFWLVDVDAGPVPGQTAWTKTWSNIPLTGSTTTWSPQVWGRNSTATSTRLANLYYTANSMIKEVVTWSSNLDASYTSACCQPSNGLRIGIGSSFPNGGFTQGPYALLIGYGAYGYGGIIRHEIGHTTHAHVHNRQRDASCASYCFNNGSPCFGSGAWTGPRGCEYGSTAMQEALPTFFAARSVSGNDTRTWSCGCWEGPTLWTGNWDICSEHAVRTTDPDGDSDWYYNCQTGDGNMPFWYMGDFRSSSTTNCVRLQTTNGCNCSTSPSPWCTNAYNSSTGWRNPEQITRFLWDMVDSNNESGLDDTNLSIGQFVAAMEGMPCAGSLGGVDGSCEEHAPPSGGACNPATDGATFPSGTGTRDSYNPWDFAELLAGDQSQERTLNCVQGAAD